MSLVLPLKRHGDAPDGVDPESGVRPYGGRWRRIAAPALAAFLAGSAYLTGWMVRGDQPFGNRPRAFNDQANQYVPLHAHLWDLVHGRAEGNFLFNWQSGFGAQFLSDYHTYLGNPVSLTTLVFPRGHIDVAVFLVTPLTIALAAATMTVYLRYLASGPGWLRAVLGTAYGVCGWAVASGGYIPMWMWGMVALPLMGIAAEWFIQNRRWLPGTLLVALSWMGNFYTAAMATVAVGLLFVLRLLLADLAWRARLAAAVRAGCAVLLGVAATAVLLYPTLLSSKASQPTKLDDFVPVPTESFLSGILPASYMPGEAPRMFVATSVLVLALAFALNTRVAVRVRVAWLGLLVAVALSFQWSPTMLMWHGMSLPNGNPYRETFVFCALVVIVAWINAANRPRVWTLAVGAFVLLLLVKWLSSEEGFNPRTWNAVLGFGGVSLAALAAVLAVPDLMRRPRSRRIVVGASAVAVMAAVVGESAYGVAQVEKKRGTETWARPLKTAGPVFDRTRAAVAGADDWPQYRTDSAPGLFNQPLLVGGEGTAYYSSYTPEATFRVLDGLGFPWLNYGRTIGAQNNPVTDIIFSIGARAEPDPAAKGRIRVTRSTVPPLVTVHQDAPVAVSPGAAGTVWGRQEQALGYRVFDIPQVAAGTGPGAAKPAASGGWTVEPHDKAAASFTARCAPGARIMWYSPRLSGTVASADGVSAANDGGTDGWLQAGVVTLGTVPASGAVRVDVTPADSGEVPAAPIACLDTRRLDAAAAELAKGGAVKVTADGNSLRAVLPPGSRGTAVIATPAVDGWSCTRQGRGVAPVTRNGLLSVPLGDGATNIACTFTPPGLAKGAALSGLGVTGMLVGGLVVPWVRRRYDRRQVSVTVPQATDR